jgi:hypothetical protein
LIMLRRMRSDSLAAGDSEIGQETRESLSIPDQEARGIEGSSLPGELSRSCAESRLGRLRKSGN